MATEVTSPIRNALEYEALLNRWDAPFRVLVVYSVLFFFPFRWQLGSVTIGLLELFTFGLAIWVVWSVVNDSSLLLRTPAAVPFFTYMAFIMLSSGAGTSAIEFVKELIKLLQAFALYIGFALLLVRTKVNRPYERAVVIWIVTFVLIVLVSAVWQYFYVISVPNPWIDPDVARRYFRLGWGSFAYSNYFAGMVLLIIPPLLYRLSAPNDLNLRLRIGGFCILAAFIIVLLLTFSRGALAAFTIGLFLMAVDPAYGRRNRRIIFGVVVLTGIVLIATLPIGARVFDFAGRSLDEIAGDRAYIWRESLRVVSNNPLLGVGFGHFDVQVSEQPWAHNFLIQSLVETGLLGTAAYVTFIGTVGWTAIRAARASSRSRDWWVFRGLLAGFVIMLLHNLVENTLIGVLYSFLFWPLGALALARHWTSCLEPSAGTGR